MTMQCFEWWAFEALGFMSGMFGVSELACSVIIINIISTINMFPAGVSYSASSQVGNYLGRKSIDKAK